MTSRQTFQQEQQRRMLQEQERRNKSVPQTQQPFQQQPHPYPQPSQQHQQHQQPPQPQPQPQPRQPRAAPPQPNRQSEEPPEQPAPAILTDEQREAIRRYIQLDDEIAELNSQLGARRAERKQIEADVLNILKAMRTPIKAGNDVLKVKKAKKQEAINQNFWIKKLEGCGELKDPARAKDLVKNIYKNRTSEDDFAVVHVKSSASE